MNKQSTNLKNKIQSSMLPTKILYYLKMKVHCKKKFPYSRNLKIIWSFSIFSSSVLCWNHKDKICSKEQVQKFSNLLKIGNCVRYIKNATVVSKLMKYLYLNASSQSLYCSIWPPVTRTPAVWAVLVMETSSHRYSPFPHRLLSQCGQHCTHYHLTCRERK